MYSIKKNIYYAAVLLASMFCLVLHARAVTGVEDIVTGFGSNDLARIEATYLTLLNNYGEVRMEYRGDPQVREAMWLAFKFLVPSPRNITDGAIDEEISVAARLLYRMGDIKETRAIPYLLANIHDSACSRVLAKMGEGVVAPVLMLLENSSESTKLGAVRTLEQMLLPKPELEYGEYWDAVGKVKVRAPNPYYGDYTPAGKVRAKIKIALRAQLLDKSPAVRLAALKAYRHVAEYEDVPLLGKISKTDMAKMGRGYFIREVAGKILEEVKAKKIDADKKSAVLGSTTPQ